MTRALAAAQPPECYGGIICPSDCPCTPRMRRAKRTLEAALRRYLKADTEAARILAPVTPPDTPGLARP